LQSTFPDDQAPLVLDASAAINFLGTGIASELLTLLDRPLLMADRAFRELRRHPMPGRDHESELSTLTDSGCIVIHTLEAEARELFFDLTSADSPNGLDDGEAATIALAVSHSRPAVPVLDDRKARNLLTRRWPSGHALYTVDLLADQRIGRGIAKAMLADAVHLALTHARMRVPTESRRWVVGLIGADRARKCRTLGRIMQAGEAA
jgi:predicted nucleic acid-binding protein